MEKQHALMDKSNYGKFALTMTISLVVMYAFMFLNVFQIDHIYISLNRFYMALLMVSPMALIMLGMMGGMYRKRKSRK